MALSDVQLQNLLREFGRYDFERDAPLYVAIGRHLASHPETLQIYEGVQEWKHRPVMLFAAVHYMVLKGEGGDLAPIFDAPNDRRSLDVAGGAFARFCDEQWDVLVELMQTRRVQTNEVNRCVGLLPALMIANRERRRSLALIELGTSAGLNLLFDRFRYDYSGGPVIGPPGATVRLSTQLRGRVPRMDPSPPPVEFRVGVDLEPVDVFDDDAVLWLRACIWAGDIARDQRFTAAVNLARKERPQTREGNAIEVLPRIVREVDETLELCIFNSWMMSWMDESETAHLHDVVASIGQHRRVWWITYEAIHGVSGIATPEGADASSSVLGLQRFDGTDVEAKPLAMVHHHGNWLDWVDGATAAF